VVGHDRDGAPGDPPGARRRPRALGLVLGVLLVLGAVPGVPGAGGEMLGQDPVTLVLGALPGEVSGQGVLPPNF